MKKLTKSLCLALLLSLIITPSAFAQNEPSPTPPVMDRAAPAMYNLAFCSSPEQLDCVSSVEVKPPSSEFVSVTTDRPQMWTLSLDNQGNQQYAGSSYWILPGTSGEQKYFAVSAQLFTPANTRVSGLLSVSVDDLPSGYMSRVSVRTSWLRPQNLQFKAASASYSHSVIPGGNLWTFTGTHSRMSNYTSQEGFDSNWSKKADVDYQSLLFVIHHAGIAPEKSWFSNRCADAGFSAQAFNAPGAGSPEWDNATQSLRFNIGAPHLDSQGNKNIGFFRLWVSESFAKCQWPDNNLVGAPSLVGTIFNEDGSIQDADITVTNENGMIYLDAKNFHYSAPTFQITASGTPIKPSSIKSSTRPSPSSSSQPSPSSSIEEPLATEDSNAYKQASVDSQTEINSPGIALVFGGFFLVVIGFAVFAFVRTKQGKPLILFAVYKEKFKKAKLRHNKAKTK
jgi:hypothetical protein